MSEASRRASKRYHGTVRGRASCLARAAKVRAIKGGLDYSINMSWVLAKLEKGCCEVTGIPFVLQIDEKYGTQNNMQPYSPALDRTDPKKGYTEDNVKVVVAVYNQAKMHWCHDDVVTLAKAILKENNDEM